MNDVTQLPDPPRNPFRDAAAEFQVMSDQLKIMEDQLRETNDLNSKLLAEVDFLRQEYSTAATQRDAYRRFAEKMTTRLAVIKETIIVAEQEAREYALHPSQRTATEPEQAEPEESEQAPVSPVRQINRLPSNAFVPERS